MSRPNAPNPDSARRGAVEATPCARRIGNAARAYARPSIPVKCPYREGRCVMSRRSRTRHAPRRDVRPGRRPPHQGRPRLSPPREPSCASHARLRSLLTCCPRRVCTLTWASSADPIDGGDLGCEVPGVWRGSRPESGRRSDRARRRWSGRRMERPRSPRRPTHAGDYLIGVRCRPASPTLSRAAIVVRQRRLTRARSRG
jgi:hypothetical protein